MPIVRPGPDFRAFVDFTIPNGDSLSNGLSLDGFRPSVVLMPSAWTAASLTFQVSKDGVTWFDLYDAGTEISSAVAASRAQALTAAAFAAVPGPYWRLRSGTGGSAVAQGAQRILTVLCRPL